MDNIEAAKYIKDHCLGSEVYRDGTTWNDAMVTAVEALEKEAEHQAKLEEIKSRFKDHYYNKGYEQGKADAKAEAIPVEWIEAEIKKLRDMDNGFASLSAGQINAMLKKWKEGQNNGADKS